ncbi:MAG TPA: hypothetical protein VF766_13855 [Pyrinomonadaceae bacterium]
MKEALVILNAADRSAARRAHEHIQSEGYHVSQSYGSDVLIAEIEPGSLESLRKHPGVVGVYKEAVPDEHVERLDETERMGIAAWNERHSASYQKAKQERKGEGLSWGHPNFEREG